MRKIFLYIIIILTAGSCREKFEANIPSPPTGYLIVEGNILVGPQAVTAVKLSYSTPLDSVRQRPETGAQVYIEDRLGNSYPLNADGLGNYYSPPLQLLPDQEYRLHLITSTNREYFSEFTMARQTPPIDSVSWEQKNDGVEIYVSTHDDRDNSRYYQWSYAETWEYFSAYLSYLKYENSGLIYRDLNTEQIFRCWSTVESSSILIASSANLEEDRIHKKMLTSFLFNNTDRLQTRYSIMVRQTVITDDAYEYLERMKKNSEQVGSIFDAQPSQLRGNIRSREDSNEIVVGFITAASVDEKRIFINNNQLTDYRGAKYYTDCLLDTILSLRPDVLRDEYGNGTRLPVSYYSPMGLPIGVIGSSVYCVDCRLRGGVNVKPPFWP